MRDVENWFETEGSAQRKQRLVVITQSDREPLEKICKALGRIGIRKRPIFRGSTAYNAVLPLEESAKFIKFFKPRVKTAKALRDLEDLEKRILEPAKHLVKSRRRAREILLSG